MGQRELFRAVYSPVKPASFVVRTIWIKKFRLWEVGGKGYYAAPFKQVVCFDARRGGGGAAHSGDVQRRRNAPFGVAAGHSQCPYRHQRHVVSNLAPLSRLPTNQSGSLIVNTTSVFFLLENSNFPVAREDSVITRKYKFDLISSAFLGVKFFFSRKILITLWLSFFLLFFDVEKLLMFCSFHFFR